MPPRVEYQKDVGVLLQDGILSRLSVCHLRYALDWMIGAKIRKIDLRDPKQSGALWSTHSARLQTIVRARSERRKRRQIWRIERRSASSISQPRLMNNSAASEP